MSMTDTTTTRPLQPPACAVWCADHGDHGLFDQECGSPIALILPDANTGTVRSYVAAQLVEHSERHAEKWVAEAPKVLLRVDDPAGTELSLAEAKRLAQTLNDLVALAELGEIAR